MCLYLVTGVSIGEDCVRLKPDTLVKGKPCNDQYVTVCQRAASLGKHDTSCKQITNKNKYLK